MMSEHPPVPRQTGRFEHDGEELYYEAIGEDELPWLVLSHGAGGNHAVWFHQVAWFARSFRLLLWDQRGFGRSSNRNGAASPSVAARDLGALLEHLGVAEASLVGQSMGGWAVMGLAVQRPELVKSLVLADTLAGLPIEEWVQRRTLPRRPQAVLGDHPALGPQFRARRPHLAVLYQQLGGWGQPDSERSGALAGLTETVFSSHETSRLSCPVLFIVGSEDEIFPPHWIRRVAATIPGALVEEIEGAGHSPYFEAPDRWNAVVTGHLARTYPTGKSPKRRRSSA
jgi:3-oxoadipate enol-lactonase